MSKLTDAIRAKHPGAYDQVDDATLEKAVLAKYPQYQSLVEPEPAPQPVDEHSVGGFLGNVASSGGQFLKDTVTGLPALAKGLAGFLDPRPQARAERGGKVMATLKAIPQAAKQRYGGLSEIGETLYHDPVGVAADVSTLAGVGGMATAARAPKLAATLKRVERATNPTQAITRPAAALADKGSDVLIGGTVRPPAAVREDFGGTKGVAQAIKRERVYSEASANRKQQKVSGQTSALLDAQEKAGVPGIDTNAATNALLSKPTQKATLRARLGEPDQSDALLDRAINIEARNPQQIPLTQAQALKREAQELAYESGADNLSVKKSGELALAQALKEGIEQRVPQVGPLNQQSQRLIGAERAFAAAEDRPRSLTNTLAAMSGGGMGAATGDPVTGILLAALIKGMDSPRAGAMAGIGLNEFGRGMNANSMRRAALAARLMGQDQE